jgi:hypothetical protein
MASILSGHTGTLPVAPSRRIAAGLSVGTNANTEPRSSLIVLRIRSIMARTGRTREDRSKTLKQALSLEITRKNARRWRA